MVYVRFGPEHRPILEAGREALIGMSPSTNTVALAPFSRQNRSRQKKQMECSQD